MPCVLLCILETVEGGALFAGAVRGAGDVGGDVLCATLYAGGCGGCAVFVEVLEVLEMLEVMRCVLLCILEAVLYLLEAPEVPKSTRCVYSACWRVSSVCWRWWR